MTRRLPPPKIRPMAILRWLEISRDALRDREAGQSYDDVPARRRLKPWR